MSSLRCSSCGVSWPQVPKDYQPCPVCLQRTDAISDAPIDAAEAHTKMCQARFQRWCEENGRADPIETLERIPVKEEA